MDWTHLLLIRLTVFTLTLSWTLGYPYGAPSQSCSDLTPQHGSSRTQTSISPYSIAVSSSTYTAKGQAITVTLKTSGTGFSGFLLTARLSETCKDQNTPVGTFDTPFGSQQICTSGSVTHTSSNLKTSIAFKWTPPSTSLGSVVFRATFVQSERIFWVDVRSSVVSDVTSGQSSGCGTSTTARTTTAQTTRLVSTTGVSLKSNITSTLSTRISLSSTTISSSGIDPNCGNTVRCFNDCVGSTCTFFLSWIPGVSTADTMTFTLNAKLGQGTQYAAFGLSKDLRMGDDSVTECVYNGYSASVYNSYNQGRLNYRIGQTGLVLKSWTFSNGWLSCSFTRIKSADNSGKRFSLTGTEYYIFFATGPASNNAIQEHSKIPVSTDETVSLEKSTSYNTDTSRAAMARPYVIPSLIIIFISVIV